MKQPTANQVLGAAIRAAAEEYIRRHQRPEGGGYSIPTRQRRHSYLAKRFNIPRNAVVFFLTYSRSCTHPWKDGACTRCPETTY